MRSKRWSLWNSCVLCLLVFCITASAQVTDPNVISGWTKVNSVASEDLAISSMLVGTETHVDRDYVFVDVTDVDGIDFVMTAVDDKTNSNLEYAVTLDKAGDLFLFIDNRVGDDELSDPPTLGGGVMDWVGADGFTETDYTIVVSGNPDVTMTMYARSVAAGTYNFDEQNDGGSRVTYLIGAIPDTYNLPPAITGVPGSANLVLPDNEIAVDATVTDTYGVDTSLTYLWQQIDAGPAVSFSPDAASEDVTITFPEEGDYMIRLTATDGDGASSNRIIEVTAAYPYFAVSAPGGDYDVELGNDSGLDASDNILSSKGLGIRNIDAPRRRVAMVQYNLSELGALGANEVFANSFLSIRGTGDDNGTIQVYGIKEHLDDYTISSASWDTAPGLPNNPTPPENSPVTLDTADLTGKLMEITPPGNGVRTSYPPSADLAQFLNDDTDGRVILLFAGLNDGVDNSIVRSRNYTSGGTGYTTPGGSTEFHGIVVVTQKRIPTWATNPVPANYASASGVTELSWDNPPEPVGTINANVYFGTDPNELGDNYELDLIAEDTADTTVTIPYALSPATQYYWLVNVTDSGTGETTTGNLWTFDTNNAPPVVSAGDDQYIWLNNAGDSDSATTTLDGTVTDDGLPAGTVTVAWQQLSGTEVIFNDPNNIEDVSINLPETGTYSFRLTADDTDASASDIIQVIVEDTPCEAAQAKPGYEDTIGDFNSDCFVNLEDFVQMAQNWLLCHPFMDVPCTP